MIDVDLCVIRSMLNLILTDSDKDFFIDEKLDITTRDTKF